MEDPQNSGPDSSHHNDLPPKSDGPIDSDGVDAELRNRLTNDSGSIGLDIDGTNPGSRSHPIDYNTLSRDVQNDNPENKDLSEE